MFTCDLTKYDIPVCGYGQPCHFREKSCFGSSHARNIRRAYAHVGKLLVDILRDTDFFYLQGSESDRIIENAFNLYTINRNRLFRYADRRKVKEELSSILENLNIQ